MINFLKLIFSSLKNEGNNDKNEQDSEIFKIKKILYISILVCAIIFAAFLLFFIIKKIPVFSSTIKESYKNSIYIVDNIKNS